MPNLSDFSSAKPIKMLLIGDSGKGKTGALASLAEAGLQVRILDFDNGLSILPSILKGKPEAIARIQYESCLDDFHMVGQKLLPKGVPTAFTKGLSLMTDWKTPSLNLGPVSSWDKKNVLVIDSLSHLSNAAMRYVLSLNKRSGEQPWQSDWGQAMSLIEQVLQLLYSDQIKCHVILTAHITHIGGEENADGKMVGVKQYPNTLGQKLPPKIPQYFNTMLQCDTLPITNKRIIRTVPNSDLGLKCEILGMPKELPLESGLADFFRAAGQL